MEENNLNIHDLLGDEDNDSINTLITDNTSVFDEFSLTTSIMDTRQQFHMDMSQLSPQELKKEIERLNKKITYNNWERTQESKKITKKK